MPNCWRASENSSQNGRVNFISIGNICSYHSQRPAELKHSSSTFINCKFSFLISLSDSLWMKYRSCPSSKCVVEHLRSADNRLSKMFILSVLRLYTKCVKVKDIKKSPSSMFLDIIEEIALLPRHEKTSVRVSWFCLWGSHFLEFATLLQSNNGFLSRLNSKDGNIASFQPYKIVCGHETFIITVSWSFLWNWIWK